MNSQWTLASGTKWFWNRSNVSSVVIQPFFFVVGTVNYRKMDHTFESSKTLTFTITCNLQRCVSAALEKPSTVTQSFDALLPDSDSASSDFSVFRGVHFQKVYFHLRYRPCQDLNFHHWRACRTCQQFLPLLPYLFSPHTARNCIPCRALKRCKYPSV